jgi:hypothetical protein
MSSEYSTNYHSRTSKVCQGGAPGDDEGDVVVVLLVGAESADFVDDGGEEVWRREGAMAAQGFDEAL